MSDPVYQGTMPGYFICDRDPTDAEPEVSVIPFPSDWIIGWWNTTNNSYFRCVDLTEDNLVWQRTVTGDFNNARAYSTVSSPSFDTSRQPSETSDVNVTASITLTGILVGSATVTPQVSADNSNWVSLPDVNLTNTVSTQDLPLNFLVPVGYYYRLVSSTSGIGANTVLNSIQELSN